VPDLPTGDIGRMFQDVIQRLAPELMMTLQAGALGQAGDVAKSIMNNPARLSAIQSAIADQAGGANVNISEMISNLVSSLTGAQSGLATGAITAPDATAASLLNTASEVITSTSSGMTVADGAVQATVQVNGNLDNVTLGQLQGTLQAFGSQIVQELVARS
jgi:hypothetical protein